MRIPLTLLVLVSSCYSALALDLKGRIHWNEHCPNIGGLGQASVTLDNGRLRGGITKDGGFVIPDVPAGTYILSVLAHDHAFEQLRIDVLDHDSLPEVRPYIPGTPLSPASPVTLPYPITLSARMKYDYFVPQEGFNIVGMFKNPMMMIMLLTAAMMLAMPYIMKNMDPEVLQDFNQRQAKIGNIQSSFQSGDIKSGFNALMSTNDEVPKNPTAVSTGKQAAPSGVKNRGGKNKRR